MALDGCGLVCKYILFVFNIIFAVVGIAFLGLGLWLRFSEGTRPIFEIEALSSSAFVIGVTVLIVLGSVMLIVVSFGDHGACSEKQCSLQVFSALVAILAAAEVLVGILAWSSSDEIAKQMAEFYSSLYALYITNGDPAMGLTLAFFHNVFQCCGVTGIPIIELVKKTCPAVGFWSINKICPKAIMDMFDSNAPLVMGVFLGTGALLIIALICSVLLSSKLHQSTSSSQYMILTQSTANLANTPLPPQHEYASTPYQEPVVFTPLTVAHIPMAQA